MKRVVVALILAMCAVAGVLTYLNDKATNGGLPLVEGATMSKVALKDYPKDHMLFLPCVGAGFAPRPKRNIV